MGAELFHAEIRTERRGTEMTKLILALQNFANDSENLYLLYTACSRRSVLCGCQYSGNLAVMR